MKKYLAILALLPSLCLAAIPGVTVFGTLPAGTFQANLFDSSFNAVQSYILSEIAAIPPVVLPSATTSQLYGGTGTNLTARAITLGTNLSITGSTLNASTTNQLNGILTNAVTACGADPTGAADSTSALTTCLSTYSGVGLPAGTYQTSSTLTVATGQTFCGSGQGTTTINVHSTTAPAITVGTASTVKICDMTLDRTGTATSGADGIHQNLADNINQGVLENITSQNNWNGFQLGPSAFSVCRQCVAQNNYSSGFLIANTATGGTLQWSMDYTLSQMNNGWGYLTKSFGTGGGAGVVAITPWTSPQSFANTQGGYAWVGTAASPITDIILNSPSSSTDGNDAFQFTYTDNVNIGGSCLIENIGSLPTGRGLSTSASHVGSGVDLVNSNASSVAQVSGCVMNTLSYFGVNNAGTLKNLLLTNLNITGAGNSGSNAVSVNQGTSGTVMAISGIQATDSVYGVYTVDGNNTSIAGSYVSGSTTGCFATTGTINLGGNQGSGCTGGGGSTSPGGSTTQIQYNNSGSFAGSANLTFDGTNTSEAGGFRSTGDSSLWSSGTGAEQYYDSTTGAIFQGYNRSSAAYTKATLAGSIVYLTTGSGTNAETCTSGACSFLARPTFNSNTPYDTGNLSFGSGLSYSGGTLTTTGGSGTVTSVNGSGGSTGLTLTGGAITTSGTLTLGGTLAVGSGGTGVTSLPGSGAQFFYNSSGSLAAGTNLSTDGTNVGSTGGFRSTGDSSLWASGTGAEYFYDSTFGAILQAYTRPSGPYGPLTLAASSFTIQGLTSDAGFTDASMCFRTANNGWYFGSGTLGTCLGTSSRRYKRDIEPVGPMLEKTMLLHPYKYRYKEGYGDNGKRLQIGPMAEDVYPIFPDRVDLDAEGKPNTVDLLGFVPVLIKDIQELQQEIDSLRRRLYHQHRRTK